MSESSDSKIKILTLLKDKNPEIDNSLSAYPFRDEIVTSELNDPRGKFKLWQQPGFNIQEAIDQLQMPTLEVAGPTPHGYFFLNDVRLPSAPHITNITKSSRILSGRENLVDEVVDGRKLPYPDGSIGVLLMSSINHSAIPPNMGRISLAELLEQEQGTHPPSVELELIASGDLEPTQAKSSLRALMYVEASRVVADNGLLVANQVDVEDRQVLERLSFEMVAAVYCDNASPNGQVRYPSLIMRRVPNPIS